MPEPIRLKAGLERLSARRLIAGLGLLCFILTVALVRVHLQSRALEREFSAFREETRILNPRAPTTLTTLRFKPSRQSPPEVANAVIGWPEPPELIDLRIDVSGIRYNAFSLTIDKIGEARIIQIRRITPDSNRELRLDLNTSAFGPGEYQLKLEGYTWRGQLEDAGWITLSLAR